MRTRPTFTILLILTVLAPFAAGQTTRPADEMASPDLDAKMQRYLYEGRKAGNAGAWTCTQPELADAIIAALADPRFLTPAKIDRERVQKRMTEMFWMYLEDPAQRRRVTAAMLPLVGRFEDPKSSNDLALMIFKTGGETAMTLLRDAVAGGTPVEPDTVLGSPIAAARRATSRRPRRRKPST